MKVRDPLNEVFAASSHVRVLRVLSSRVHPMTGRQVARETGLHPQSTLNALERLEGLGLVERRRGGRDHSFSLNRSHWLSQQTLLPLFRQERKFRQALEARLVAAADGTVESLVLFGSTVRGEDRPESDLDVCVVTRDGAARRKAEQRLHEVSKRLSDEFGVRVAWLFLSAEDFFRRGRRGDPLVQSLLSEGRLLLGKPLSEVIRREA